MFGFVWVRIHTEDVFSEDYMSFLLFWLVFYKNGTNKQNLENFRGPTLRRGDPYAAA